MTEPCAHKKRKDLGYAFLCEECRVVLSPLMDPEGSFFHPERSFERKGDR